MLVRRVLEERGEAVDVGFEIDGLVVGETRCSRKDLRWKIVALEVLDGDRFWIGVEDARVEEIVSMGDISIERRVVALTGYAKDASYVPLAVNDLFSMQECQCLGQTGREPKELEKGELEAFFDQFFQKSEGAVGVSVPGDQEIVGEVFVIARNL
jgi:hypothetical protein